MNLPIPEYIKTKGLWNKVFVLVFVLAASAMFVFSYFHIDNRLSKIKDRQRTTRGDVASIVTQFSGLKDDINVLNKKSEGLTGIATQFSGLKDDINVLNKKSEGLTGIATQFSGLKDDIKVLKAKVEGVSGKQNRVERMVGELREINNRDAINRSTGTADHTPNVIMVISDTLRADHVSAINPLAEPKTANIDRLARMGVLFTNAIAQAPSTAPAMGSIFTGLYPSEHKAYRGMLYWNRFKNDYQVIKGVGSFVDILRANSYSAGYITQNYAPSGHGMPMTEIFYQSSNRKPKVVINAALEFLRVASSPFFLYLHVFDPHRPYSNALDIDPTLLPTGGNLEAEHKYYRLEVQGVDRELGRLIDYLLSRDYFKDNVFIFLADHGEYFNEHPEFHTTKRPIDTLTSWDHGFELYQDLIHVPLIIVTPETFKKGIVVDQFVETRALFSTILDLTLSHEVDTKIYQKSLMPIMLRGEKSGYCISEGKGMLFIPYRFEEKSIISPNGLKLINNTLTKTDKVFDLTHDPEELHPLDPTTRLQEIIALKDVLTKRTDLNSDFIKPQPFRAIHAMERNKSIAGIASSDSISYILESPFSPIRLLDDNPATFWQNEPDSPQPIYITITLKRPAKLKGLSILLHENVAQWFSTAELFGSNEGFSWHKITDIVPKDNSPTNNTLMATVSTEQPYRSYKLEMKKDGEGNPGIISISELRLILEETAK